MAAAASVAAAVVVSCKRKFVEAERIDLASVPVQTVNKMFFTTSENGLLKMRMEADVMQRFDNDSLSCEFFPEGFEVYGYDEEGRLETMIQRRAEERWEAFGNVVIQNVIKQETMETDTLYWDQTKKEIYTDCYIRMFSKDGFMQGYGMRSDEHARNAIIYKPFNSYGVVVQDTTAFVVDSVNFIGPFPKK